MLTPPVVVRSRSEPLLTADGYGALTSTNTNVSTSTTARTASQVASGNRLSMMGKSIDSLGDTMARFSPKRLSSGVSSRQTRQSRSMHRVHYSY